MKSSIIRTIFAIAAICLTASADETKWNIFVLTNSESDSSTQVADALRSTVKNANVQVIGNAAYSGIEGGRNVIVALGPSSIETSIQNPSQPTIGVVSSNESCESYKRKFVTTKRSVEFSCIISTPSPKYPLASIKAIYPIGATALVVLSDQTIKESTAFEAAAKKLNVPLRIVQFHEPKDILSALANSPRPTVLITTPDSAVYNKFTIKPILDIAYDNNVPMVGHASAYTNAGALISVFIDRKTIIENISKEINYYRDHNRFSESVSEPNFDVTINSTVADSLNIILGSAQELKSRIESIARSLQ